MQTLQRTLHMEEKKLVQLFDTFKTIF